MTMADRIKVHDEIVKADNERRNPSVEECIEHMLDDEWWAQFPISKPHGDLVELRWEPYTDVFIYEDGYVYRDYIGD